MNIAFTAVLDLCRL